ncbi:MAG: hypothetical protein M3542_01485 [Acidobacteriota bacterium]|nr:hypothetical protein [Acidobacteriota bacterium]MDQ5871131.1 hypothetical protein [Acidobacteriota bacterium]
MSGVPDDRPNLRRALPGLLFVLLVVAVYSPTLFSRRNFAGRDLLVYNLPIEKTIHDAYSRGSLPVWMPEVSGGRPLLPNPNAGALYPLRFLLSVFSFPVAMRLFPIVHWAAAGVGMMLFLRSIAASRAAGWVGAVTYVFSGVAVAEVFFPHIQPGMTLLPWILWAVARPTPSQGRKLLLLSTLFALIMLAGDVFSIGTALLCAGLWILTEKSRSEWRRELVLLALGVALAGLVALPQILATLLWVPDTNRSILGMKLQETFFFSISPFRLLEFVVPYFFGSTWTHDWWTVWGRPVFRFKNAGIFSTLYCGALSVMAVMPSWRWRAPAARFARILLVFALFVSVAPNLLPSRWGGLPSPLPLRFPEKFAVAIVLALAVLTALAVDRFRSSGRSPRWALVAAGVLAAAAGLAAVFSEHAGRLAVGFVGSPPWPADVPRIPIGLQEIAGRELPPVLAEAGLFWVITVIALDRLVRPGRRRLVVALVLLTIVPIASNRRIAGSIREEEMLSPGPFARSIDRRDPVEMYRTLGESYYAEPSEIERRQMAADPEGVDDSWILYRQALVGKGTVFNFDFDSGDSARMESLRKLSQAAANAGDPPTFFGSLALRWGIRFRDQKPVPGYERFGGTGVHDWDELREAHPDVRLVQAWRETVGPLQASRLVLGLEPGEVVVESGLERAGRAGSGTVRVLERGPARLRATLDAPDPTWLFVLRGFWNYRTVLLDGKMVEPFPAQLAFSAVAIPAGRHTIDWTEEIPGLEVSRYGPLVAAGLLALLLIRDRRRTGGRTTRRADPEQ